jgi:hypothetical protein
LSIKSPGVTAPGTFYIMSTYPVNNHASEILLYELKNIKSKISNINLRTAKLQYFYRITYFAATSNVKVINQVKPSTGIGGYILHAKVKSSCPYSTIVENGKKNKGTFAPDSFNSPAHYSVLILF